LTVVALFNILPPLADTSLKLALWVAVGVTMGSLVAAILTGVFNTIGRRVLERDGFLQPHPTAKKARGGLMETIMDFFRHLKDFSIEFWFIAILNFTFFCLLAFVGFSTVYFSSKYGTLNFTPKKPTNCNCDTPK